MLTKKQLQKEGTIEYVNDDHLLEVYYGRLLGGYYGYKVTFNLQVMKTTKTFGPCLKEVKRLVKKYDLHLSIREGQGPISVTVAK